MEKEYLKSKRGGWLLTSTDSGFLMHWFHNVTRLHPVHIYRSPCANAALIESNRKFPSQHGQISNEISVINSALVGSDAGR